MLLGQLEVLSNVEDMTTVNFLIIAVGEESGTSEFVGYFGGLTFFGGYDSN